MKNMNVQFCRDHTVDSEFWGLHRTRYFSVISRAPGTSIHGSDRDSGVEDGPAYCIMRGIPTLMASAGAGVQDVLIVQDRGVSEFPSSRISAQSVTGV